jgi:TRAP-type transport system small permease protein
MSSRSLVRTAPAALARVENVALGLALSGMAVVVLLQVGARLLAGTPPTWSSEVATDLLVWTAFLGFAVAVRERGHVSLPVLEERLRGWVLYAVRLGQLVVFAFLLGSLTYGGVSLAVAEAGATSPSGIPHWAVFASVPVGAGLGLVHVIAEAFRLAALPPRAAEPEEPGVEAEAVGGVS